MIKNFTTEELCEIFKDKNKKWNRKYVYNISGGSKQVFSKEPKKTKKNLKNKKTVKKEKVFFFYFD